MPDLTGLQRSVAKDQIMTGRIISLCCNKCTETGRDVVEMIPKDPVMLLSFLNLKLRDYYKSLDELCDDMDIDKQEIIDKLMEIGYYYDNENSAFVQHS